MLVSNRFNDASELLQGSGRNGRSFSNDTRRALGKPPVEGGDKVFISCNVQPIEAASQKVELPKNEETNI